MATPRLRTVVCDLSALTSQADAGILDALARLQLILRRHGLQLLVRGASPELLELLALAGLVEALGVESRGQAEQREHGVGVEEESQLDDPGA
jgi:hypothetical protein